MYKILVVEDEELIRSTIQLNLEREGYGVWSSRDAEGMLKLVSLEYFDLILLDIFLPGMPGDIALKRLKSAGIKTPVIMLTARTDVETKVETFNSGADDYLSKPFAMKELLARIQAVIRRSQGERVIPSNRKMKVGEMLVDLEKRVASTTEGEVVLSEREVLLLEYFNRHVGEVLKRADILEEVWGMNADPTPRTIDNYIVKFRRLFESIPDSPKHFISVRSKGYRFLP